MRVGFDNFLTAYAFEKRAQKILEELEKESPKFITNDVGHKITVSIELSSELEDSDKIIKELEIIKNKLKKIEDVFDCREDGSKYQMTIETLFNDLGNLFKEELEKLYFHSSNFKSHNLTNYMQSLVKDCSFRALGE